MPVTVACEILIATVPEFVNVNVCELLDPAMTFPKLMLVELAASEPGVELLEVVFDAGVPALVKPTQPERVRAIKIVANVVIKAT